MTILPDEELETRNVRNLLRIKQKAVKYLSFLHYGQDASKPGQDPEPYERYVERLRAIIERIGRA